MACTCTTSGHLPHSCPHALFAMNAIQESRQYSIHVYIITLASSDVVFFHSENYKICAQEKIVLNTVEAEILDEVVFICKVVVVFIAVPYCLFYIS